jgi:hypothetical protein
VFRFPALEAQHPGVWEVHLRKRTLPPVVVTVTLTFSRAQNHQVQEDGPAAAAAGAIAGSTVVLSKGAIVDWKTALIAAAALAFVLRFKNKEPVLVALAAAAGLLLHGL